MDAIPDKMTAVCMGPERNHLLTKETDVPRPAGRQGRHSKATASVPAVCTELLFGNADGVHQVF